MIGSRVLENNSIQMGHVIDSSNLARVLAFRFCTAVEEGGRIGRAAGAGAAAEEEELLPDPDPAPASALVPSPDPYLD